MSGFMIFTLVLAVLAIVFAFQAIKVVPQQSAWIVERLGKFHAVLSPGLNVVIPFIDRVAYKHSLKEIPLDTPSQVCITKDNTQLSVDGVLFFQVTDPMRASYGTSNYVIAITQLAQTTLRSVIGKMELDKTFEERDLINRSVVSAIDEAALNWGVKVLRYEIKDLRPSVKSAPWWQLPKVVSKNRLTWQPVLVRRLLPNRKVKSKRRSTRLKVRRLPHWPSPRQPQKP